MFQQKSAVISKSNESDNMSTHSIPVAVQRDLDLVDAIMAGESDKVRSLIREGAHVNSRDFDTLTKEQLSKKAWGHCEPLALAVDYLYPIYDTPSPHRLEIVKTLLENGTDVHTKDWQGHTPLHMAAMCRKLEAAELLLQHGAEINKQDAKGNTPLHCALSDTRFGSLSQSPRYVALIKQLLDWGADPCKQNNQGQTPLDIASQEAQQLVEKHFVSLLKCKVESLHLQIKTLELMGSVSKPKQQQEQDPQQAANERALVLASPIWSDSGSDNQSVEKEAFLPKETGESEKETAEEDSFNWSRICGGGCSIQ